MIRNKRITAYIALPMVHKEDFSFNEMYVKMIEELGMEVVSKWVTSMDITPPRKVFLRDIKSIEKSDMIIADVSEPSHGVGMELMYAFLKGKRIIVTARVGSKVSYMILGMPNIKIVWYNSFNDLKVKLETIFSHIKD